MNEKILINKLCINNRIVMAPIAHGYSDDGFVSDKLIAYYDERTKNRNIGLVILEHSYVREDGKASRNQLSVSTDNNIDGLSNLVSTIHKNGSRVFMQLSHAGSSIRKEIVDVEGISPSGIINPNGILGSGSPQKSHAMSEDEIKEIIEDFKRAAIRVKKAGFDGIEIHSAHGYLLNQFYSPLTNKRKDSYNGDTIKGRIKLHIEIINAIRSEVGNDFPIGIRLGGADYISGGSTIEDAVNASIELEKAGYDFIDVSGGMCFFTKVDDNSPGYFKDQSINIKNNISVPVILTGGVKNKEDIISLLKNETADMIGVGRMIAQNKNWATEQEIDSF